MKIESLYMQYPNFNNLTDIQKKTYQHIKFSIDEFNYINVENNDSYIMLYLNELLQKLLTSNYACDFFTDKIRFIKQYYKADFLQDYCSIWLGDIYFYYDRFEKALESWTEGLRLDKIWTLLSSKIISLKLNENVPINAQEALTYKKNITKYGKNNFELVIKYVDNIIRQDYLDHTICTEYFLATKENIKVQACLFTGCMFGYDINKKYNSRNNHRYDLHIEGLLKLTSYINDVSRRAENAIREDLGMPRIGEGWISETDLYYKIKKYFCELTVIQHYNDEWLGKQHLDVYIKELNIGIEFHGLQHFQPVEFFGGQEAFIENQKRDKKKISKCNKNRTTLLIVKDGYDINMLIEKIKNLTHASTL